MKNEKTLPRPSDQFIEKYIECYNKGEQITDILVEYDDFIPNDGINLNNGYYTALKVNPKDNTITIKKVKDNFTRDEVIKILKSYKGFVLKQQHSLQNLNKWIEENL